MDLYFQRHDGQAVTCEDFFAAMRDANGAEFSNFLLWYVLDAASGLCGESFSVLKFPEINNAGTPKLGHRV